MRRLNLVSMVPVRCAEGYGVEITIPPSVSEPAPEWVLICKPESGYTAPSESR